VFWSNQIQRWDGTRWYRYGNPFSSWSSFNYYGQGVTRWSGGRFVNSTLNLPVSQPGYYRVAAVINGNQGGVDWAGFIREGAYCYMR
jgi:hypothetical protein